jgi:hypothetical protein
MPQPSGRHDKFLRLHRSARTSPWVSLGWRLLLALALIGLALAVHWFDRDGLKDNVDGTISFIDVLYFTMITVTTVGYGDIVPVTEQARLFDTFLLTPIRLFVWLLFSGHGLSVPAARGLGEMADGKHTGQFARPRRRRGLWHERVGGGARTGPARPRSSEHRRDRRE